MAKRPSPTTPDRPPSILSEFGEGYCRWCYFVVGLTPYGLLAPHTRGKNGDGWGAVDKACKGGDTAPPRVTPYSSRKAMFRVTPSTAYCPGCVREVPTAWISGVHVYADHRMSPSVLCDWRFRAIDSERNIVT